MCTEGGWPRPIYQGKLQAPIEMTDKDARDTSTWESHCDSVDEKPLAKLSVACRSRVEISPTSPSTSVSEARLVTAFIHFWSFLYNSKNTRYSGHNQSPMNVGSIPALFTVLQPVASPGLRPAVFPLFADAPVLILPGIEVQKRRGGLPEYREGDPKEAVSQHLLGGRLGLFKVFGNGNERELP